VERYTCGGEHRGCSLHLSRNVFGSSCISFGRMACNNTFVRVCCNQSTNLLFQSNSLVSISNTIVCRMIHAIHMAGLPCMYFIRASGHWEKWTISESHQTLDTADKAESVLRSEAAQSDFRSGSVYVNHTGKLIISAMLKTELKLKISAQISV
jgi:hypothetical protein